MPSRKLFINSSLAIVAIAPIVLYAIVPGPGYTGAPGDSPTGCIASGCHTGTPNSGIGSIRIAASGGGVYVPGEPQQISVTITDSTEKKYGFQLSPRIDSNPKTAGAGTLTIGKDGYTVIEKNSTLQWINHTVAGYNASNSTPGSFTYTFSWTPPATNVGTVTLYAAGEAVTGADVVTGTETYLTSLQLSPAGQTPVVMAAVNAASFAAPIASGSWVSIFGANLAPPGDARPWSPSTEIVNGKLPVSLDGTSVMINGKPAAIAFLSPTQLNIQLPDDAALGPVPVVITTAAGGSSAAFMATYAQFAPGLFPATATARPGDVITLWGTGFGPADPPVPAGQTFSGANPLANTVTATIGGQPAAIQFAGIVGAGLVQINVQVPAGIASGDVPVILSVGGVSTQSTANLITILD